MLYNFWTLTGLYRYFSTWGLILRGFAGIDRSEEASQKNSGEEDGSVHHLSPS
jgi:hypothetical protein